MVVLKVTRSLFGESLKGWLVVGWDRGEMSTGLGAKAIVEGP